MRGRKNVVILVGFVLSVSLLAVSITTMLLSNYYKHTHMQMLGEIFRKIIEKQPEAEQAILEALKEYKYGPGTAGSGQQCCLPKGRGSMYIAAGCTE